MTHTYSEATPPRRRRPFRRRLAAAVLASMLACATALGGMLLQPVPAEAAAVQGAGGHWTPHHGWLGNYIVGGQRVYCIDLLTDTAGSGGAGTLSDSISEGGHGTRPVSGAELRRINYAVSVWGQTDDPILAAAVGAYVYNFTSANWYGQGAHYITGPHATAILAKYEQVSADTEANYRQGESRGTGKMQLDTDAVNHYRGTLRITGLSPENARGSVTLANGVFADTGLSTRDGVTNNSSFAVLGVPPADGSNYRIRAEGEFRAEGKRIYDSNVTIHSEGSMQRTAGPGGSRASAMRFALEAEDADERSSDFRPIVGTRVASKFVAQGEEFSDLLSFATQADEEGLDNPWYRHPEQGYAAVKAIGTLYGPFLAQPEESDEVPPSAPVVVSGVEVQTTAERGPEIEYTVPSGVLADEAGFYTWVWSIVSEQQGETTRAFLPDGYAFQDRFGRVMETSITPSNLLITTALTRTEAGIGQAIADEVTVQVYDGGWLQAGGARVPATLTGTAYYSEAEPVLADAAPADAEIIGTMSLTANRPGATMSDELRLPLKEGYVTFQWCLKEAEQPEEFRGLLRETCDLYGQASETVRVLAPTVATEAAPTSTVHDPIFDTAVVTGPVPEHAQLEFSVYKQPQAGDLKQVEEGVAETRWTRAEVEALGDEPLCTAENLTATTSRIPVEPGENESARYRSPEVKVEREGRYWWIERLVHVDPETRVETTLRSGRCGLLNETTSVERPAVVTEAVKTAQAGAEVYDTAMVSGPVPGASSGLRAELTFEVFESSEGPAECTPRNRVLQLDRPVAVTAAGSYRSETVRLSKPGRYFWVETLTYVNETGGREIVHVGECGLPSETTTVLAELPTTGSATRSSSAPLWAAALLLVGSGALAIGTLARRKRG